MIPATFLVYTITDRFRARSIIEWQPGWVQNEGEFAAPFFTFWFVNFGLWLPITLLLIGMTWHQAWRSLGGQPGSARPKTMSTESERTAVRH